jgi:Bacterial transcriptional activator domain/WD domain, G-beta repeat
MRIAVLGPLEVLTDASVPVALPGPAERLLLAVLVAGAPGVVSTDRLRAAVSDGGTPEAADGSFRAHLTGLRGALEPGLPDRSSGQYVLRRGPGYGLAVARSDIDALRSETLTTRGRAALASGDPAEAARLLSTALALWRGEPYADWPGMGLFEGERSRLRELRIRAEEALADARRQQQAHPEPVFPTAVRLRVPPHDPEPLPVITEPPASDVARRDGAAEALLDVRRAGGAEALVDARRDGAAEAVVDARGDGAGHPPRRPWQALALTAVLVAALVVAVVVTRSQQGADQAATSTERPTVADEADRLAALSASEGPLDVSLLLAVQAVRLRETSRSRARLFDALTALGRVERVVPIPGVPQAAVLSGGGRALAVGIGESVVVWPVGPSTLPRTLMPFPGEWGAWIVAAGSPTEQVVLSAGTNVDGPWIRTVSAMDGSSRLLLGGMQKVGGTPVDGAVSPDGRRFLLVLADPDPAAPEDSARWHVVDVAAGDGARRDTGISGSLPVPIEFLSADVADDARSVVVWDAGGQAPAVLVELAGGTRTRIAPHFRLAATTAFRAVPPGAAQLWDDGVVTLVDRAGRTVQELDAHPGRVREVVVAPDGTWAVTAGDEGGVFRWDVDPSTGRWSEPEALPGHVGGVVDVAADAESRRLFTVALDRRVLVWDMSADGGPTGERARRLPTMGASAQLAQACAVVGRDLTRAEWSRFLPDRPWEPTCTDLL